MEQILPAFERTTPPEAAEAALALGKLARLLPAMVAAPVKPGWASLPGGADLLSVPAGDLLAYPLELAASLTKVAEVAVPLEAARDARLIAFRALDQGIEHMAILVGDPGMPSRHRWCGCIRNASPATCWAACAAIAARNCKARSPAWRRKGAGAVLYLAQEGRGIGLINKLRAYTLQDHGLDTVDANRALGWDADERNFHIAAAMLEALGLPRIRLLTNNPEKVASLRACGIEVVERVAHEFAPNGVNDHYLATKARRFGHLLG